MNFLNSLFNKEHFLIQTKTGPFLSVRFYSAYIYCLIYQLLNIICTLKTGPFKEPEISSHIGVAVQIIHN